MMTKCQPICFKQRFKQRKYASNLSKLKSKNAFNFININFSYRNIIFGISREKASESHTVFLITRKDKNRIIL